MTTTKKIIIAVVIAAIISIGVYMYMKSKNSGNTSGSISEIQAKETAKIIADLFETTADPTNVDKANALILELKNAGWKYEGYNKVSKI